MSQAQRPSRPLWDWAVDVYARPGVKDALLALQNTHGADVPLVLWRLWLLEAGLAPAPDALARAITLSETWRAAVVSPLRAARDALKATTFTGIEKDGASALRTDILTTELAAEKLQLAALEAAPAHTDPDTDALSALRALPALESASTSELSQLFNALEER